MPPPSAKRKGNARLRRAPSIRDKGAVLQAEYYANKARANGMTSAEAKKVADSTLDRYNSAKPTKKGKELSDDEIKIREFAQKNAGLCGGYGVWYSVGAINQLIAREHGSMQEFDTIWRKYPPTIQVDTGTSCILLESAALAFVF